MENKRENISKHIGVFTVKPANEWISESKLLPVPSMLFGELWYEGELCILFADTNQGKSILAVQIANSITTGIRIKGMALEAPIQDVLYLDFELHAKQFEARYSKDYQDHHEFNDNFLRIELNADAVDFASKSYDQSVLDSIERSVVETGAKVIIVDNITYLKDEMENAKAASPLMKGLKALKTSYRLSILVLSHTPKRDLTKPITRNDLAGSKMQINFCDSAFAIGESQLDSNTKYLKQVKTRNGEEVYGPENVIVCEIEKPENFLRFKINGYEDEQNHLKERSKQTSDELKKEALKLREEGYNNTQIGQRLNRSEGAVRKWFKQMDV